MKHPSGTYSGAIRKDCGTGEMPQRGATLVELLVSMIIGAILITAVFYFFSVQSKSFEESRSLAEMQQEVRWASEYLSDRLKLAGNGVPPACGWNPIAIVSGSGGVPDSVTVLGSYRSPVIVTAQAMANELSQIECESAVELETGDLAVISDGTFTEIFKVTNIIGNRLYHEQAQPWNDDNRLDHAYGAGSTIHVIEQYTFSVNVDETGCPNLMVETQSAGPQILAGGIEQFQIRFKMKSGEWSDTVDSVYDIREMEVLLRARSPEPISGYHDPEYGDGYRRLELKNLVIPKNLIII